MQVTADTQLIDIHPGGNAEVVLDVRNTGSIIDGVLTRVIGLSAGDVTSKPALLPLFPDATGQVTLSVALPTSYPAGRHAVTIEVTSAGAMLPPAYLDLDMVVAPRLELQMSSRPQVVRARRQARFVLELANTGNLPLDLRLVATDADRAVSSNFNPDRLRVEAGAVGICVLTVRGPRMIVGTEVDRILTLEAVGTPSVPDSLLVPIKPAELQDDDEDWLAELRAPAHPGEALTAPLPAMPGAAQSAAEITDAEAAAVPQQVIRSTTVRLRQRPVLSRGLLTALILLSILALWAAAFLLGLNQVFKGDPMTKAAPASFFAAAQSSSASGGAANGAAAAGAGGAPAGALPKTGPLPPGVGAVVNGTVTAASTHQPVGRILVEALRNTSRGLQVVSSAATQTDGTYSLAGLFPTGYLVRFSASGYKTVWYPSGTAQAGAKTVAASAEAPTQGIDATITGLPASIQGSIDPGETLQPVTATVTAKSLIGTSTKPVATTTTAADGSYRLPNLAAPGTYELSYVAPGYQPTTVVVSVSGGQRRFQSTVRLSVGAGSISGTVTDGTKPLGGVAITTTVNGKNITLGTPTSGAIGTFTIGSLPTPATYVLSATASGYGAQTIVVYLGPGQNRAAVPITLISGVGSVSGQLVDLNGDGIGGATVTVGGAPTAVSSTTLSAGAVGHFGFNALPAPGSYTLTFSLAGFAPTTVPVTLTADGAPPQVTVTMANALGRITGQVLGPTGVPAVGATVTATDGKQSWKALATGAGGGVPAGGYLLADLLPGTYTVTVTQVGLSQQTALVTVTAGVTAVQDLQLGVGG